MAEGTGERGNGPAGPLAGRLALVTGASRGIGRAAAVALGRAGAHVVLVARTMGALEETDDLIRAAGGSATLLSLDLKAGQRVDALGPTLYQRWGKLDVLVSSGAVLGPLSPLAHVIEAAFNEVLAVNVTANWHLIRTLDPLLRRSDAGRAVFLTCEAAEGKTAYWGPYALSKAALEAMVRTYADEVATTNVRVNLLDSGPMATALRRRAFPGEPETAQPAPEVLAPTFVSLASPAFEMNGFTFAFDRETGEARPRGGPPRR